MRVKQTFAFLLLVLLPFSGCLDETSEGEDETIGIANPCNENELFSTLEPRVSEHSLVQEIDGEQLTRKYLIQAPTVIDESKCYPLLFALHGNGGQPGQFVGQYREMVDAGNFIGIYPEGIERS